MSTALQMLDETINFLRSNNMGQKPIWVTEASNNKGGTTPGKGPNTSASGRSCASAPPYKASPISSPPPTTPTSRRKWVTGGSSRGIAEVVGAR